MAKSKIDRAGITNRLNVTPFIQHAEGLFGCLVRHHGWNENDPHTQEFRKWLYEYVQGIANSLADDLIKGSERGMRSLIDLLVSDEYEEVERNRRKKERERWKEYRDKSAAERQRIERGELTEQERLQRIMRLRQDIEYHKKCYEEAQDKLLQAEDRSKPLELDIDPDFWEM